MMTEKDLLNKFIELLQQMPNAYALFDSPANQEQLNSSAIPRLLAGTIIPFKSNAVKEGKHVN